MISYSFGLGCKSKFSQPWIHWNRFLYKLNWYRKRLRRIYWIHWTQEVESTDTVNGNCWWLCASYFIFGRQWKCQIHNRRYFVVFWQINCFVISTEILKFTSFTTSWWRSQCQSKFLTALRQNNWKIRK